MNPNQLLGMYAALTDKRVAGERGLAPNLAAAYDAAVAAKDAAETALAALKTAAGALNTALAAEGADIADCADEIAAVAALLV